MRVTKRVWVYMSWSVASESEIFSRRHATPQHDKGFIDWWSDGGGNSCRLEDLNKITYAEITIPKSTQHHRSTCPGRGAMGEQRALHSQSSSPLLTLIINFSLQWFSLVPIKVTIRIWGTKPARQWSWYLTSVIFNALSPPSLGIPILCHLPWRFWSKLKPVLYPQFLSVA